MLNDIDIITKPREENTIIPTSQGNINLIHFLQADPRQEPYGTPAALLEGDFIAVEGKDNNEHKRIPINTVLCIHGSYSDSRIFSYIGRQLSENGFNVYSMDLPGHGKSQGKRGDLDFEACLASINEVVHKIKEDSHVFILAHSIGCTFALWYARNFKKNINGLILMAPYIRIRHLKKRSAAEPGIVSFLYLIFRRILTPKTQVKITEALPRLASAAGEEFTHMLQDKDLNFFYSYRYILDVIALRNSKVKELIDISSGSDNDLSILILHGSNDLIFFPSISQAYFKLLKVKNKKIKIFDCNHWFYGSLSYKENSQSFAKYPEQSRLEIVATIREWIHENDTRTTLLETSG